jgi:hypothetical protein
MPLLVRVESRRKNSQVKLAERFSDEEEELAFELLQGVPAKSCWSVPESRGRVNARLRPHRALMLPLDAMTFFKRSERLVLVPEMCFRHDTYACPGMRRLADQTPHTFLCFFGRSRRRRAERVFAGGTTCHSGPETKMPQRSNSFGSSFDTLAGSKTKTTCGETCL